MSTWLHDEHGVPRMRLIYDGRILDIEDNLVGWVVFLIVQFIQPGLSM